MIFVLPVVLLLAAVVAIRQELKGFSPAELKVALKELKGTSLALASLVTAFDYLLLGGYDLLALRYAERSLPFPRVLFTSFVSGFR